MDLREELEMAQAATREVIQFFIAVLFLLFSL